ncbi:Protein of unknown function [Cotesia congregata]|uniref:Uncharacterized protein n=1 Tax=Cotesia congregata TaxID=51543 RepID=A0A8J2GZV9_COTCN|nr:Protein of unknown function [Cotesia congregata]
MPPRRANPQPCCSITTAFACTGSVLSFGVAVRVTIPRNFKSGTHNLNKLGRLKVDCSTTGQSGIISEINKQVTYFCKLLSIGEPSFLRELFIEDEFRRSERLAIKNNNVNNLILKFATSYLEHSFVISAIRLWQKLPVEVLDASSLEVMLPSFVYYIVTQHFYCTFAANLLE